jgi:hypothetical protein
MAARLVLTKHPACRAQHTFGLGQARGASPNWIEPDPRDPEVTRAFGRIKEAGGKVLRVAYSDRLDGRYVLLWSFRRQADAETRSMRMTYHPAADARYLYLTGCRGSTHRGGRPRLDARFRQRRPGDRDALRLEAPKRQTDANGVRQPDTLGRRSGGVRNARLTASAARPTLPPDAGRGRSSSGRTCIGSGSSRSSPGGSPRPDRRRWPS